MKQTKKHTILGVHITDRVKRVRAVQKVFTEHGCFIKTRIGLHDAGGDCCSSTGLILLEVVGADGKTREMVKQLKAIAGVDVKKMEFAH
jgi:hypothetical protein